MNILAHAARHPIQFFHFLVYFTKWWIRGEIKVRRLRT